jgi:CIC family chloride channel protein
MIGGLLIGVFGFYFPQVLGGSYHALTEVLHSQFPLNLMIILIVVKILATSITLGSGGIGGVLTPSLFIGALLGGSLGSVVHHLWPTLTATPSAYALVGMAAVLATITGAPLTAVLLVFEFTGDAHILMPLLLTTGISLFLAQYAPGAPLYTVALWRYHIPWGSDSPHDLIPHRQVVQVMTTQVETVPMTMELSELARTFDRSGAQALLVKDPYGAFYGLLSLSALKQALICEATNSPTAGDITTTTVATVYHDEFVAAAVHHMTSGDLWCLPVVDRSQPPRLLGVVYREDLHRVCHANEMRTGSNRQ